MKDGSIQKAFVYFKIDLCLMLSCVQTFRLLSVHCPRFVVMLDGKGSHGNRSSSRNNTTVSSRALGGKLRNHGVFCVSRVPPSVLGHCAAGAQKASVELAPSCRGLACAAELPKSRPRATNSVEPVSGCSSLPSTSCSLFHPRLLSTQHPRCPQPAQTQHLVSMDMQAWHQK